MEESIVSTDDYVFANDMNKWKRMNLIKPLLRALDERNLNAPTEVQTQTIPKGLNTKTNILAAAETGSGKTIAFALPIVQKIHGHLEKFGDGAITTQVKIQTADEEANKNTDFSIFGMETKKEGPLGLVLCPTRELAVQVHDQIKYISKYTKVRTGVIIGGMSTDKQGIFSHYETVSDYIFRTRSNKNTTSYYCCYAWSFLGVTISRSRFLTELGSSQVLCV
jgi:ATP-dependent RNA helicase DDX24/MAK5